MLKKYTYIIILIPIICSFCHKEKDFSASPSLDKDISNLMTDFIEDGKFAGMGLLYYSNKNGELSFAAGNSDIEKNLPMDTSSVYDIGSTTKMFISILTLQLIDEGTLTLETPVHNWIDNLPSDSTITIRHLLNHTSGLNDYLANGSFLEKYYAASDNKFTLDDIINAGLDDTTSVVTGVWKYSNTNYLILAKIIESTTKNSIAQELKHKIFDKAGMVNTYYMPAYSVTQIDGLATGYQFGNAMKTDKNYFLFNAAGGIVSTLSDMNKFAKWVMNSGYLDGMMSNPVDCLIENGLKTNYGKGLIIAEDLFNTNMLGHGGNSFGFKSEFWFSQETGEIIIYFVNDYMYKKTFRNFRGELNEILQQYRTYNMSK